MNLPRHNAVSLHGTPSGVRADASLRASVLVVVIWIVFGLVAITLYFASSMTYELRASDNRVAGLEAEAAIEGARRYITCVLSNLNQPGVIPDGQSYLREAVPVGKAKFWLIGRTNVDNINFTTVTFGLIDEGSKLNLNSAFVTTNLALLPRMTDELALNIMSWKSTNADNQTGGAESQTYMMLSPPYLCKNAPFETVNELRLVHNLDLDILFGEDANMNGIVDANENDGDSLPPSDNMDTRLDPGLFEYTTVYSVEPANQTNGDPRINLSTAGSATQLQALLLEIFGDSRGNQIAQSAGLTGGGGGGGGGGFGGFGGGGGGGGGANVTFTSPLQFYMASGMTPAEFAQIEGSIRGADIRGLINVNTASSAVLACLPGMDEGKAQQLVASRQSILASPDNQNTVAWVSQVLDAQTVLTTGRYLTGRSYQFTADIAAVGHEGRGYRRTRFVFDLSSGAPVIVYRQDLTHLGWALGKEVRTQLMAAK